MEGARVGTAAPKLYCSLVDSHKERLEERGCRGHHTLILLPRP